MECDACGYRFVSPRPTQEAIAGSYSEDDFYDGWLKSETGRLRMWNKRLDLLPRDREKVRLLDVGAGIGTFLSLARDRLGWEVTGTEVSASAVRIARDRHGLELLVGQVEDIDLPAGGFDMITLWHVLEHLPFPGRTLELCRSLLAPGGVLVIGVPNDDEARSMLVEAKARLRRRAAAPRYEPLRPRSEIHLSHLSSRVLARALEARGFKVELVTVDDQYADPTPRSERLVRGYRLIRRMTGLNFGQATMVIARKAASVSASSPA
jgi:SAM-dependent methyltransferase